MSLLGIQLTSVHVFTSLIRIEQIAALPYLPSKGTVRCLYPTSLFYGLFMSWNECVHAKDFGLP